MSFSSLLLRVRSYSDLRWMVIGRCQLPSNSAFNQVMILGSKYGPERKRCAGTCLRAVYCSLCGMSTLSWFTAEMKDRSSHCWSTRGLTLFHDEHLQHLQIALQFFYAHANATVYYVARWLFLSLSTTET